MLTKKSPQWWRRLMQGARLMVGVGDYETYLAHMRSHHPEHALLSREQYVQRCMNARYGGEGGRVGKCPC